MSVTMWTSLLSDVMQWAFHFCCILSKMYNPGPVIRQAQTEGHLYKVSDN